MKTITEQEFYNKPKSHTGVWSNPEHPEYIGKRTMLDYDEKHGTVLLIEGYSLRVV